MFSETEYRQVYQSHKANLEAFDTLCNDAHNILLKIRKRLYSEARYVVPRHLLSFGNMLLYSRFHSGAESSNPGTNTLSRDILTHALQQAMDAADNYDDEDGIQDD